MVVLPLCPVYGVGAVLILYLAPWAGGNLLVLFGIGAAAATVVEYGMALWYEQVLGVSFWDYSELRGNLQGEVCIPFSLAWGVLALGLVRWVHPGVLPVIGEIPFGLTVSMLILVVTDTVVSAVMLRRTGNRDCLRWYRFGRAG
jgi:uncharacterized membrane protein